MRKPKLSLIPIIAAIMLFAALAMAASAGQSICPRINETNATIKTLGGTLNSAIWKSNLSDTWYYMESPAGDTPATLINFSTTTATWTASATDLAFKMGDAGSSTKLTIAEAYNATNKNATEILAAFGTFLTFMYWNGSNMTNNTNIGGGFSIATSNFEGESTIWIPHFPSGDVSTIISINESNTGLSASIVNHTNVYRNDSLAAGIAITSRDVEFDSVYNLSGNNTWNVVSFGDISEPLTIYNWNGSQWVNVTPKYTPSITNSNRNSAQAVFDFITSRGNFTFFPQFTAAASFGFSGFSKFGDLSVNSSSVNATASAGEFVNLSFGTNSRCGAAQINIETNISGSNVNISTLTGLGDNTRVNITANVSIGTGCNKVAGYFIFLTDMANDIYKFAAATTRLTPSLYNQTAGLASVSSLACTSRTNATIVWNNTINVNITVTLNMSGIFFGNNQTCGYKANNVSQLRAVNKTSGCEVTVVNANAGGNITVEQSSELGAERGGNLGVAIAASSAAAIVVAYAIARRRRAEE